MSLIGFLVFAAVIGLIVYVIVSLIPMPVVAKNVIIAVACIALLLGALRVFGIWM